MNNYIKEIKAILVFTTIGIIIFGFFTLLTYFKFENYFYYCLIGYIIFISILSISSSIIKSSFLRKINQFSLVPAGILYIILTILLPLGFLLIHLLYYVSIVLIIPSIIIKLLELIKLPLLLNNETLTYIKFTSSVFIAVLFNFQIRRLIYIFSPARLKSSEKIKPYELDKITDYLISENNVRFCIYSIYAFLLITMNINNLENDFISESFNSDKAILQSFVTFIAFDRALTLLKQLEFKPSDLLDKIIKSIINKLKHIDSINRKY